MRHVEDPNHQFVEQGRSYRSERLVDPSGDCRDLGPPNCEFESFEHHASLEVQREPYRTQRLHLDMRTNPRT